MSNLARSAGEQCLGQALYERQQHLRAHGVLPGPRIIAVQLHQPDNIGHVLRLADAAGSAEVVFVGAATVDEKRTLKAARNCHTLVTWRTASMAQFLEQAPAYHPMIAVEITSTSRSIFTDALPRDCALVIGNERYGVPTDILAQCDRAVHIPMFGVNGSMNVSHALAIAVFTWRQQHGPYDARNTDVIPSTTITGMRTTNT